MTKDHILEEIRRTAAENGGVPLGKQRFFSETGIRESDWSGRWWTRWSEAVREAGLEPQSLNQALPEDAVLEAAVRIIRHLGHFPTAAELRLVIRQLAGIPSHNTFSRFGGMRGLRERVILYSTERGLSDVLSILQVASALPPVTDPAAPPEPSLEEGFVYLLKSGRYYKIGKANSISRRERELAIQLPERAEIVHRIRTDDPLGVENYWHRRFALKRLNGEWFDLKPEDVKIFRRRKFM